MAIGSAFAAIRERTSLIDAFLAHSPEKTFLMQWHPGKDEDLSVWTFGSFLNLSRGIAAFLKARGLGGGDVVILIMPQGVELMASFVGAMMIGAIPTILAYPNFKIDPQKYRTGLAGVTQNIAARLVVVDPSFPPQFLEIISSPAPHSVVQLPSFDPAQTAVEEDCAFPERREIAFLQHSAGTTGLQKGVALSHQVVLNQIIHLAEVLDLKADDRIINWLPLYHDMGLIACFMFPLACGIPVVMQSPVDWVMNPGSFLELAVRLRCTLAWLPNFAFQFLARRVRDETRESLDLSYLRTIISTSEPVRSHSLEEFYQAYCGCGLRRTSLQTSYGMAENTFAVTNSRIDGKSVPPVLSVHRHQLRCNGTVQIVPEQDREALQVVSCGFCLPNTHVEILGEKGQTLPEGEVGEIVVQSDCLFSGYYKRPDLSREVLIEDCYRSGDLGFLWRQQLYVLGRKDDVIVIGGKNLHPQDIEEIAFGHPRIRDGRAVAFGVSNRQRGTQDLFVIAEVSRLEDLAEDLQISSEIRQTVLEEIGVAPRLVKVVGPHWLVKSSAGKIARSTSRMRFLQEHPEIAMDSDDWHGEA